MNFVPLVVQKILSNHVLFLFADNCCHKTKLSKVPNVTLILFFYEISEYVNLFCLKTFPLQKKLLMNANFVKTRLHVNAVHEKLWAN